MAEGGECRTVKDHLPLDSTLRRKERGGVYWNFDAHGGSARETVGGFERARTLNGKEHTRVGRGDILPTVLIYQVRFEPE